MGIGTVGKAIEKKLGKFGTMKMIGVAGNVAFVGSSYKTAREEGKGQLGSIASAAADGIMWDVVGMKGMIALGAAKMLPGAVVGGVEKLSALQRSMTNNSINSPFHNATFADSQQASTMRQAGMKLAESSKYNLQQSLLGNEAQYLHI